MEWKQTVLSVLVVLLLVPAVSAASISDVNLTYFGHPVLTLGSEKLTDVTFSFSVSGSGLTNCETNAGCAANINLDEFVEGAYNKQFPLGNCQFAVDTYNCTLPGLTIFTSDEELNYTIAVINFGSGGNPNVAETISAFPVVYDTTTPVLTSLNTSYCNAQGCFIGSVADTYVNITFEDDTSSFVYEMVKVKIVTDGGSSEGHAISCSGLTCIAKVTTRSCTENSPVHVTVTDYAYARGIPSSEDALNPVDSSHTLTATCDATNPVFSTPLQVWSGGAVSVLYETAQPLHFSATITDAPSRVARVRVNSDTLLTNEMVFDCTENPTSSGEYLCADQITTLVNGTHDLTFTFEDAVGNYVEETRTIIVLESVDQPDIDFISTDITDITPTPMNRVALQLAVGNSVNYPVLIDYVLQGSSDITIVSQSLDNMDCVWDNKTLSNTSSNFNLFSRERSLILKPTAGIGEENRFVMNIHTAAGQLPDVLFGRCEYDVYVAKGNQFFMAPERESFEFQLHFFNSVLGSPGEAFVKELKIAEKKMDGGLGKALEKINKIGGYADAFCGVHTLLVSVDGFASALQATQFPILQQTGDAINAPMEAILTALGDKDDSDSGTGKSGKFALAPKDFSFAGMCNWWTCADAQDSGGFLGGKDGEGGLTCGNINDWVSSKNGKEIKFDFNKNKENQNILGNKKLDSVVVPVEDYVQNAASAGFSVAKTGTAPPTGSGEYCAPQYSKSLLTSLGLTGTGFCAKGVLFNLGKWHGIDCGYVSCLKEQSSLGANINVCKQAKDFKECTAVFDEIFELPLLNVMTRTSALVNANVQDIGMKMVNLGVGQFCAPAENFARVMAEQLMVMAIDATTGGYASAALKIQGLISKFTKAKRLIKLTDPIVKAKPTTGNFPKLFCNLVDSSMRFSEVNHLLNGGLSFQVADSTAICEGARCNGPDCDRGGISNDYLNRFASLGLLIKGEQGDETHAQREATGLAKLNQDAFTGLITKTLEIHTAGKSQDVKNAIAGLTQANGVGGTLEGAAKTAAIASVKKQYPSLSDPDATFAVDEYNKIGNLQNKYTIQKNSDGEWIAVYKNSASSDVTSVALTVSESEKVALSAALGENTVKLTGEDVAKLAYAKEHCTGTCTDAEVAAIAADPNFELSKTPEAMAEAAKNSISIGLTEGAGQELIKELDKLNKGTGDPEKFNTLLASKCAKGYTCTKDLSTPKILICKGDGAKCNQGETPVEITRDDLIKQNVKEAAWGPLMTIGADYMSKWLYDQGYLDNLKLSSWGDWGAKAAAKADKLWNPETWKTNLCSSEIEILIDDDPLVGLGSSTGPALTFAAERRALNGTYIYTISYFIRTDKEENRVWLKADGADINWTPNPELGVNITVNDQLVGGVSIVNETLYNELCIVFEDRFPDNLGERQYCRPFVESAYER